ncbi:Spc24 subunit of Ndc80-domain-containing protein [Sordaria sp. MPI-SDFR-AT-0083]|nr:Spc24 subunit of Ndc80-domain-containing protein [Sordaria sp. MPI-SDFR-AT-0083]
MLLEEDPSTLISHTTQNFNIEPDRNAVSRVAESLSTLQQARDLRLRESETNLKKLARTLNTLQSQHQEVTSSHSSAEHASLISRLDTQKFRVAKNVSDLEMETERLQTQLAEMQARLQELELQGVDGGDGTIAQTTGEGNGNGNGNGYGGWNGGGGMRSVEDEVLLRLKVYRSLGIEIEREEQDGEFTRAVVRNDRRGDVCVVNVDRHRFSRFFYANYFWQTL